MRKIEAVTFDFFNTLVRHRHGDGGRGAMLMAYLQFQGLDSDPWQHQALYHVLEPHAREYAPDQTPAERRRYLGLLAERIFDRLNVRCAPGEARNHAARIWQDDLEGARRAGMRAVWLCRSDELEAPMQRAIRSLDGLLPILGIAHATQ